MRKSRKFNIIINTIEIDSDFLYNKISDLHVEIIRRNLLNNQFTQKQKLDIIDGIITKIKTNGSVV